jgi:hypothetical protein
MPKWKFDIVAIGESFGLLEISMKILAPVIYLLSVGALFSLPVHAQSAAITSPNFEIEIHTEEAASPRYKVTNLTGKTATACVVRLSSSMESKDQAHTVWDALIQNVPPIEPNSSISQFLGHRVGGPLPDNVEVVAGVWVDGETFGQPDWVNIILKGRESQVAAYDQAITLLRQGMGEKWTREQYLQALNKEPNSAPFHRIRDTLTANDNLDEQSERMNRLMQKMLDSFAEKSDQLKKAKPTPGNVAPG